MLIGIIRPAMVFPAEQPGQSMAVGGLPEANGGGKKKPGWKMLFLIVGLEKIP
jgi:hypothetical protein